MLLEMKFQHNKLLQVRKYISFFFQTIWFEIDFLYRVNIRIQQRNGRKSITTVQGLASDLNLKRILKAWKKSFTCNGAIVDDDEHGKVIQLQGDQRMNVRDFLVAEEINRKEDIVVHGF